MQGLEKILKYSLSVNCVLCKNLSNLDYRVVQIMYCPLQLTLPKVHTVHMVKSAVPLKWQVEFKNRMIMAPIFTIMFISKMLTLGPSHN